MVSSTPTYASRLRQSWQTVRPLSWRPAAGVLAGLLACVPLLVVGLLALHQLPVTDPHISGQQAVARELAQFLTYTGCALVGLLVSLSTVVALNGQSATGTRLSLPRAFGRALVRVPMTLAAGLATAAWALVTFVGAPVFVVLALGRALLWQYRVRTAGSDFDRAVGFTARRTALVSAVPFMAFVRAVVLVAFALTTATLGTGSVRSVLAHARAAARGRTLRGVGFLAPATAFNVLLGTLALPALKSAGPGSTSLPGLAVVALYVAGTTALGLSLGLLAASSGVSPNGPTTTVRRSPVPWRHGRSLLSFKRQVSATTAMTVAFAMLATFIHPGTAMAATSTDLVVNTLADSLTPDPGECQTMSTCSLRGALAYATSLGSPPFTITFSVSGTIATLDTLPVPDGVSLDGHDAITLDGQNSHGVIDVVAGDSASAALAHISVINGKSDTAGAGVSAPTANLTLDHVHFANNISGITGDTGVNGGAVSANYANVTVLDSTFDHNTALAGRGGAVSANYLTWTNSTSYANYGELLEATGGALYSSFGGTVTHGTILGGGGISGATNTPIRVVNTLSDTDHGTGEFACFNVTRATDPEPSVGNVDITGSCGGKAANPGPVAPLADNGGPTPTVGLLAGAGALGAGDSALCLATDQRGHARTASSCDAGAYQLSAGDVAATVTVDAVPPGVDVQSDAFIVHVEVPSGYSPAGHLVVLDGTAVNGPGVDIVPFGPGNTVGAAMVAYTLAPGKHSLSVRFTPVSSLLAVSNSTPFSYTARADASAKITATAPLTVGQATTIRVDMNPVDASASLLTPTGDVEISNGADTTTLTLASGAVSWPVPALRRGTVTVRYLGDSYFRAITFSSVVSTTDVPSASTVALSTSTPTVGVQTTATARVIGGGTPAYGRVQLSVDGTLVTAGPLVDGAFTDKLATDKLAVGTHTATVEYVPEAGWAASTTSTTFEVLPAPVTATLTFDHPSITWGDFATGTVHLTSAHDGGVTVDLMAADTVLKSTTAYISGGTGSVDIPLFQLVRPGTGPVHVRVTGGDRFAPSVSPSVTLDVAPAKTATLISAPSFARFPPVAGSPMTLRINVTPFTSHGVPIDGTVNVFLNGTPAGTFHVTDTSTDVQVTPTMGGIVDTRAEFTDTSPSPALLPSTDARGLSVGPGASTALAGAWAGARKPGATQLAVTLAGASGTLNIVDTNGFSYGSGTLTNGTAKLDFTGHATSYAGLFLAYGGDASHQPVSVLLPPITLTAWASTTTATAATTVGRDATLTVHASVTGLPADTAGNVELFDGTDPVVSRTLPASGEVDLPFTSMALGPHSLRARFTPTIGGDVLGSDSPVTVVTVLDHGAPTVHLSAPNSVLAGDDFTVAVTAAAGQYGLGAGSSVALVRTGDTSGRPLASGVLAATANGLGVTITVPGQQAGQLSLTGVYNYGTYGQSASTDPLTVTIAPAAPTLSVTAAGPLTFGDVVPVTLSANAPTALRNSAGVLKVALTANGVKVGDVTMMRTDSATGPLWTGTATVIAAHAGALTLEATTAGDGASISAAATSTTVWVARRATTVTMSDRTPDRVGRAPHDLNVNFRAVGGFSQLSAADLAALRITLSGSAGTCVVAGLLCTFPAGVVPAGDSTAYASYPGSTDFAPSYTSTGVHAGPRYSEMAVTMDPPVSAWSYGQDVHVTWRTDTSGAPAAGTAYFTAGSADCHGPALAGTCTLKLPAWDGNGDNPGLRVTEQFAPSDDAPQVERVYTVTPTGCVWVNLSQAHVRPGTGASCGPDRYLTNTPITVVADPGPNMHVDGWTLNGKPPVDGVVVFSPQLFTHDKVPAVEESLTFTPKTGTVVRTSERWAPVCYTLQLGGSDHWAIKNSGGMVSAYTPPNCSSPWMPTAAERADQNAGVASYAEGTVVSLTAIPHNTYRPAGTDIVEHPDFTIESWGNATPDPQHPSTIASITMTENRAVDAAFKVDDCSAFVLNQPTGATMRVVSTQRPDSSMYLRPSSGACTTKDGRAGYVPGTTAVVEVTPHNDGSVRPPPERDQYFVQGLAFSPVGVNAVGAFPDAGAYRTSKFDTTLSRTLNPTVLSAQMAHIACVPLATRLEIPYGAHPPEVTYADTPNCPAHPGTFTHVDMAGGAFVAHTTTNWFVEGSGTNVYVANTPVGLSYPSFQYDVARPDYDVVVDSLGDRRSEDRMHPLFAVAVAGKPMSTYTLGHWIALDEGSDPVVVGRWMSDQCVPLHLSLPTGGRIKVSPETPQCMSGSYPSYVKTLWVSVDGLPSNDTPRLMPWFSVDAYSDPTGKTFSPTSNTDKLTANGRWYSPDYRGSVELNTNYLPRMRMEVCAKINIVVQVEDASGRRTPLAHQDRYITTDGGCPPGWAQAGRDMHVGLTEAGNYAYEIIGPVAHQPATLTVANDGTNPGVSMVLRAFCYHLNAGEDVNITTPANCPGGGGGDFVRGTVVQLDADVHPGDHFHGWGPVDGKDGQTAFVAMTADRTVTVDVGHASTAQKIAAGFSSVAQRIVGLGATIVTGLIMAEAAAFALSSLAIKAATALAKVFGASDSVIVFMEAIGTEIDAEIGVFTSMATCTSSWAAGGSGTLVPGGAPGGAIKAGDWAAMKKTNMMLVSKGTSQGNADLITGAVNPVDWVNAFGSHADNYLADPAQAWGDIGSIGTCMKDRVADYQVTLGLGPAG